MIELSPRLELPEHVRDFHHGVRADLDTFAGDIISQSQRGPVFVHDPLVLHDMSLLSQTHAMIKQDPSDIRMHAVLPAADALWFEKYSHSHNLNVFSLVDSVVGPFVPAIHSNHVAKAMRDASARHICFVIGRTHDARKQVIENMGQVAQSASHVSYSSHLSLDAMLWLCTKAGFPATDLEKLRDHRHELRALMHLSTTDMYFRHNIIKQGDVGYVCSNHTMPRLEDLAYRLNLHMPETVGYRLGGSSRAMRQAIEQLGYRGTREALDNFDTNSREKGEYD